MLRDTLSPDEQMIRAFMILVGKGSLAGAASALGLYAEDYAYDLMRLAPLLGVSADLSTYDALGSDDPQVLSACLARCATSAVPERWRPQRPCAFWPSAGTS